MEIIKYKMMKDIKNFGLSELNDTELGKVEGGLWGFGPLQIGAHLGRTVAATYYNMGVFYV